MPSLSVVEALFNLQIHAGDMIPWAIDSFQAVSGWKWVEVLPSIKELPSCALKDPTKYSVAEGFLEKMSNVLNGQ
jgi:hypothetical protein